MKNKMLALVEMAVVLCSMLLVALPATAFAAEQDDYVLGVYGNANEDDTIDMRDLTYVKLIFFGKKPETELADAKYDGKINPLDFIQIKLIIVGKEKELTLIDSVDRIVTIDKPSERIVASWRGILELLRTVKLETNRVVGVGSYCQSSGKPPWMVNYKIFFPEYQDKPTVTISDPESILKLDPDLVLLAAGIGGGSDPDLTQKVLEAAGITVFRMHGGVWGGDVGEEAIRVGYIFDKQEEAEEFRDWHEGIANLIEEKVDEIPEDDKPKVYVEGSGKWKAVDESRAQVERAGGVNIFSDIPSLTSVDPEEVIVRDPDIIVKGVMESYGGYGVDADDTAKLEELREEIMSRPELQNVKVIKEGRVYVTNGYILNYGPSAGCRGFLQIAYMAKWFHPELFWDLDPKAIHQEYLTRFQGLDFDLDEKGVFVYPEPS
jgi:iron complex transport system substrate-binding protein